MIFKKAGINISLILKETAELENEERISKISEYFLNTPYKKDTLNRCIDGEEILTIDFEGVDCITFIEYVEALRLSTDLDLFINNLKYVRYFDGIVDFHKRRHFFTDWDFLETVENITSEIGQNYLQKKFKELNKKNKEKKWIESLSIKSREINYIPINQIGRIIPKLNSTLYCGFYTSEEGLDVTHVGILMKKEDFLTLRHASSIKGKVVDESFLSYIKDKEGIIIYKPLFR